MMYEPRGEGDLDRVDRPGGAINMRSARPKFGICDRDTPHGGEPEPFASVGLKFTKRGSAQVHRLVQHCVENRGEVAGTGVDDLKHLARLSAGDRAR